MYDCVGVEDGTESLHVKVMKVKFSSRAREEGVHCQMYLKSIALGTRSGERKFGTPLLIGANLSRKIINKTQNDRDGDIWRAVNDSYCVDTEKLITIVDRILAHAYMSKKLVLVELVEYIA